MNLVKVEELVQYLIGPSYVLRDHESSVEILREAILKLAPPEKALIRSHYLGEVTLSAGLSKKSIYVYLVHARRSISAALTSNQKQKLVDSCNDILDCFYTTPTSWTKSDLAKMWFPHYPNKKQKVSHLVRLANKAGIIHGRRDGFTPEEARILSKLLVERRKRKWRSKQKEK